MARSNYNTSVFINCPFDTAYGALLDAIVFGVHDCGFVARCSLEIQDASEVHLTKILPLIADCRFGTHDISRTELDSVNGLPRFNMPLELGLFLGAKRFGNRENKSKVCLVFDIERYRYQKFCSDIAEQDPVSHNGDPEAAIAAERNWLVAYSTPRLPGANRIVGRYGRFRAALPVMCANADLDPTALIFPDYAALVVDWLLEDASA